jgi:sugar lactone lactonase YvrE
MMTSLRVLRQLAPAAFLACVLSAVVLAASPVFWTISSQADFLKGDVEDLSIDSDGRVFLGPAASLVAETSAPFLWSIVSGADGTIWAGSGNEGKVLKIGRDGKVTTFFDAAELEVHAIAAAPNGGLYVATSPGGQIYAVAPDGASRVLFDPEDKYIWALASDKAGNVYAATGDKGTIYRITPDGKGTRFYKTSATNVVSLAIMGNGDVIAGTESPGRVFRIDASGKAFVLLDSSFREIHALRPGSDGTIYAAAVSAGPAVAPDRAPDPAPTDISRPAIPSVSAEITSMSVVESATAPGAPPPSISRAPRRQPRGAIYRIRPDGLWDTVWETGDDAPYDLLIESDGSLLVGTGTEGKIFRVSGDPALATLLARAAARQVTALLREGSGRIVGATSNPGKIFALSSAPAKRGTYESDIRDAGTVASWGAIRWRSSNRSGQLQLVTRSGNTATPDETWSAWSKPYTNADGEQITSPNARYLQWRAAFASESGNGPVLTSVTAAYLPRNLRPDVLSITVHPPGTIFQRPFSTGEMEIAGFEDNTSDGRPPTQASASQPPTSPAPSPTLGRRAYQKGLQTFVWRADDENDDRLQYEAFYRREGETAWKPLRRLLWDPIFVWDTTSVPDGTYIVKIAASDAPSNSPGAALTGELESTTFDIDNSPPRIEVQTPAKPGGRVISFVVRDDHSAIQRVEYSLDASRWRIVYPKDGIPDSRREEFDVTLEEGETGRNVIIRATDAMNNIATAVSEVRR